MGKKKAPVSDPVRRIALLWGSQTEAGRSGLTVAAIVAAGMALADAEGVEALSMRNVAERLGVGTMSLYTHVPAKADLLDIMMDTAYGKLYASVDEPMQQGGDWRDALRFIARRNWEMYRQHPWMLHLTGNRPVLGPHASLKYEAELRPLEGIGLSDIEMDASLTLVLTHVEGCARQLANIERNQQETGMTDSEWWLIQAPIMDRIVDSSRFPVANRVGQSAGEAYDAASSPEHVFTFGLERILAGIGLLIAAK